MTTSVESSIRPETERGRRATGAALAASISLYAAVVLGAAADADVLRGFVAGEALGFVAVGAAIGVPVGALLGWVHAPAAAASRGLRRVGLIAWLATMAVLLGAGLLSVAMAVGGLVDVAPDLAGVAAAAGSAVLVFVFGPMIFGIPAWVLAAVVCAVWVTLLGAVTGNEPSDDAHAMTPAGR